MPCDRYCATCQAIQDRDGDREQPKKTQRSTPSQRKRSRWIKRLQMRNEWIENPKPQQ